VAPWVPLNAAGVLGARPGMPFQAYPVMYNPALPVFNAYAPPSAPTYDYAAMYNTAPRHSQGLPAGLRTGSLTPARPHMSPIAKVTLPRLIPLQALILAAL
jgi:hypothetical protein